MAKRRFRQRAAPQPASSAVSGPSGYDNLTARRAYAAERRYLPNFDRYADFYPSTAQVGLPPPKRLSTRAYSTSGPPVRAPKPPRDYTNTHEIGGPKLRTPVSRAVMTHNQAVMARKKPSPKRPAPPPAGRRYE